MTTTTDQLIKDALHYLLDVQEIAARPYIIGKVIDMPTIRECTHKAVIKLLTADATLSKQEEKKHLTPEELEKHGYHRLGWNRDTIIEYWKSFGKNFNTRIGVRFGERRDVLFTVWLIFPSYMHALNHITTIEQVEQLHALLSNCKPQDEEAEP